MNGKKRDGTEHLVSYIFGRCEQLLDDFARSTGLSPVEIAHRVGELLLSQTNGTLVGTKYNLPDMPEESAAGDQAVEQVEMAERAHRRASSVETVTYKRRQRYNPNGPMQTISYQRRVKPRRKYRGKHWMQLPQNRARMMKAVRHMTKLAKEKVR